MPTTICLAANTLHYPQEGGHFWVYLNWALGFRAVGCRIIWMECVSHSRNVGVLQSQIQTLKKRLQPFRLGDCVALYTHGGEPLPKDVAEDCILLESALEADLLFNMDYACVPERLLARFHRTALLDIDPGLLQIWLVNGSMSLAPHDIYFTIGETVGQPFACFPDAGLEWHFTPPCVSLDHWPAMQAETGAAFTTISHWQAEEWVEHRGEIYCNDKRSAFLPYLDLPRHVSDPLELALCLGAHEEDQRELLEARGWRVRDAYDVASCPDDYRRYIQQSMAEFSCAKPSCKRLQNAWISDRTICYLASGKPAVVEHTGSSRYLPDTDGLFRFRSFDDAIAAMRTIGADYEGQRRKARAVAEDFFDAKKVAAAVLECAL
jgi:hypothetical protein